MLDWQASEGLGCQDALRKTGMRCQTSGSNQAFFKVLSYFNRKQRSR